ncbi:MAG: aminotransferase class I/II-fold pyridoxal phosphate-dependent enzyme, partial [Thermosulfidibacteraceae bacterium]
MDIFAKCFEFKDHEIVKSEGIYPYFRAISSSQSPIVEIGGRKVVMLGSNNYLGLTDDPRVREAAKRAIDKYGTGCAGSRFLNGTVELHIQLEEELANFIGKEAVLVYSTGFQTNLGIISTIVGPSDVVILDKSDHASIFEGCMLSLGWSVYLGMGNVRIERFRHNDVRHLRKVLEDIGNNCGKLIIVDGVYSMEGNIAPLPEIISVAKEYGARVMVDDAHGIGVLGNTGAGTAEHFGLT